MVTIMGKQNRWMKWVLDEADKLNVNMPWHRQFRSTAWKNRLLSVDFRRLLSKG